MHQFTTLKTYNGAYYTPSSHRNPVDSVVVLRRPGIIAGGDPQKLEIFGVKEK
jgi:hypothetical protein